VDLFGGGRAPRVDLVQSTASTEAGWTVGTWIATRRGSGIGVDALLPDGAPRPDLARNLGVPTRLNGALAAAVGGEDRAIDAGVIRFRVGSEEHRRHFFVATGFGMDVDMIEGAATPRNADSGGRPTWVRSFGRCRGAIGSPSRTASTAKTPSRRRSIRCSSAAPGSSRAG
jgi:hypothetical protein